METRTPRTRWKTRTRRTRRKTRTPTRAKLYNKVIPNTFLYKGNPIVLYCTVLYASSLSSFYMCMCMVAVVGVNIVTTAHTSRMRKKNKNNRILPNSVRVVVKTKSLDCTSCSFSVCIPYSSKTLVNS